MEDQKVAVDEARRTAQHASVKSKVEGDMDVRGALGLSDEVRNGFTAIRVKFSIQAQAPREKIEEVVRRAYARSAVFDSITKGVPIEVSVA